MTKQFRIAIGLLCFVVVLASVAVLSSCARTDAKSKAQSYKYDGYLGTTNANPNFPTHRDFHNYTSDLDMAKRALQPIQGIRSSKVTFKGTNLLVTLQLDPNTDIEKAMQIKNAAHDAIAFMLPRYDVNVMIGKKMPTTPG